MNEYLLRHAIANVWCNPAQDRQFVFRLARLSPKHGVQGNLNLFYEKIALPTTNERYHVFQIGKVLPLNLGLPQELRRWISLSELANDHLLFTDLYVDNGIQFPRFESWVWITPSRSLVVVTKVNNRVQSLDQQNLYLRFYSNAFFDSNRSSGKRYLHTAGLQVKTNNELLAFQYALITLVSQVGGHPYYFINGRFANNISLATAAVGDYVEYIIDGSIKRMVEFPVTGLPSFTSVLDAANKYILHYDDPTVQSIEFLDDVDVFLIKPGLAGRFLGVTYHRNTDDWLRMLTHKDYSIPVNRLDTYVTTHPIDPRSTVDPVRWPSDDWNSPQELVVRLYIRNSGYDRPLIAESNRIEELYRLPSDKILRAMTGVDSTLDLWRAANLEQCPYVQFMSADPSFVYPIAFNRPDANSLGKEAAQQFAGDVYGYHAAATILAGTPSTTFNRDGLLVAELAYEHWYNATVYEFDSAGLLLGHYHHDVGQTYYIARNSTCARIEALTGRGTTNAPIHFGNTPVAIPYGHGLRVYISTKWSGNPRGDWRDITDDPVELAMHGFLDDTSDERRWIWTHSDSAYYGALAIDDAFTVGDITLRRANGVLRFSFTNVETHSGVPETKIMDIPGGQVDLFLNQRALIEGLDYIIRWPEVVISNLEYLVSGDNQVVHWRSYNFCDSSLQRQPTTEVGFLTYGVLSRDQEYDIHTHKVQRVVIDGRYVDPATLVFDEQYNDQTIAGVRNGAPYVIQTPPVVFRDVYELDQTARAEDDVRDQTVSNYMTVFYPPHPRPPVDFIPTQYHVVSVFANKVLADIQAGYLAPEGFDEQYSDQQVRQWCAAYEWLLDYDVLVQGYDEVHVQVWPHWFGTEVELNLYQYHLFNRALRVFLQNPPDIAAFVKIVSLA